MVDEHIWRGFQRQLDEVSRLPGLRQWWVARKDWFSDEFQAFIDGLVARSPETRPELFEVDGCEAYSVGAGNESLGLGLPVRRLKFRAS